MKKLHPLQGLDDNAFDNKFHNILGIHHPNVVRLIGYCNESRNKYVEHNGEPADFADEMERALCLEYVQGGSLEKHISGVCAHACAISCSIYLACQDK